mgnify:CR=1 FL=1
MSALYSWLAALAIVMEERMTPRVIFQAASIPVCVFGGWLCVLMDIWQMAVPFALLGLTFTLALIWGE